MDDRPMPQPKTPNPALPNEAGKLPDEQTPIEVAQQAASASATAAILGKILAIYTAVVVTVALALVVLNTRDTNRIARKVAECTTPGGRCYEDQRRSNLDFRQVLLNDNARLQATMLEATNCLTLEMFTHRRANEAAHQLNATEHGYTYKAPAGEVPPPVPEQLREACKNFLPTNQGGSQP